ncbi:MAG: hypothetical protein M4579_007097 [Chaenotheca gracillima]|nr:MAG: hypothetical protein M4579_007097 [Chaenotheca gracillima]
MERSQPHDHVAPIADRGPPNDPTINDGDAVEQARRDAPLPIEDDESDWEYEYDTNERETFYVSLDLSSSLPPLKLGRKRPADDIDSSSVEDDETRGPASTLASDLPAEVSRNAGVIRDRGWRRHHPAEDHIQIMDLHSSNPIASYQNHIFSCQWSHNLGTELVFVHASDESDIKSLPMLRSTPKYNLLGSTSLRLSSIPAQLTSSRKRRSQEQDADLRSELADQAEVVEPSKVPIGPEATRQRQDQGRFLERLMETKESLGESDEVTVFARKRMLGTGWRSQMRAKREVEREELMRRAAEGNAEAVRQLAELDAEVRQDEQDQESIVSLSWAKSGQPGGQDNEIVHTQP